MIVKERYYEIVDEILSNNFDGKIAIDATMGNGHDTLKLLNTVGKNGFVYSFDIQKEAIFKTEKLINGEFDNYKLLLRNHTEIDQIANCDLVIYNLGYLPGKTKDITTIADTTIISLNKAISILNKNGIIIIVSYVGHKNSHQEREAVEAFLKNLDQKLFKVEKREFFNQINNPPVVYLIEKKDL